VVYYSKTKGWWGIERKVQIKHLSFPFQTNEKLSYLHVEYVKYSLEKCPCPVFVDKEMIDLVENATIILEKRGMYKFLSLTYWKMNEKIDWKWL